MVPTGLGSFEMMVLDTQPRQWYTHRKGLKTTIPTSKWRILAHAFTMPSMW
jgi:hypothetical protein